MHFFDSVCTPIFNILIVMYLACREMAYHRAKLFAVIAIYLEYRRPHNRHTTEKADYKRYLNTHLRRQMYAAVVYTCGYRDSGR